MKKKILITVLTILFAIISCSGCALWDNEVNELKTKLSNSDIQAANVEKAIGEFKNIKNLLLEFDSSIDSTEDIKVKRQLIRNIVKSVKYNEVDKTFFREFYHP